MTRRYSWRAAGVTIEKVHARCEECGDCLLWVGSHNHSGIPKIRDASARRIVWELANGREIPDGQVISTTCGSERCLEPTHLVARSKGEVSRLAATRPDVRAKKMASAARVARAERGKITMEIAREIRSSPDTGRQWAQRLDVSESLVSRVRVNKSWRDSANPFGGLIR